LPAVVAKREGGHRISRSFLGRPLQMRTSRG
jgi:hypothetical protein